MPVTVKTPVPFDLTTLQTESYRCFGIAPKDTLAIAQNLYIEGYISYPRTSSQKLPKEIGFIEILKALQKLVEYKELCAILLAKKELVPNEGKKSDPAHPAIYPTGVAPKISNPREKKVYDLIVRRFFSVFVEAAIRETMQIIIDINKENFITKGTITLEKNWHKFYGKYVGSKEDELPPVEIGEKIDVKKIDMLDKQTQPPKRYTPASIIKELEKRNLGTKSTRAAIVEALYDRDYVHEKSISATELGIRTVKTLEQYSPKILDEKLTKGFEEHMEKIRMGMEEPDDVLEEARTVLYDVLMGFKDNETDIGKELVKAYRDTREHESTVGKCPKCEIGDLRIIYSKKLKKRFIVCNRSPDCRTLFQIPQTGKLKSLHKECKHCNYPMIQAQMGKRPQQICLNPDCPSKKLEDAGAQKEIDDLTSGKLELKCPKCGKNLLVRQSIYGKFLGCSGYPKCKHTQKIEGKSEKKDDKTKEDKSDKKEK